MAERITQGSDLETAENPPNALSFQLPPSGRANRKKGRILIWTIAILVLIVIALGIAAQIAIDRVEPTLRARVIETLDTRFDSRVELDKFHVSVFRGFEVEGDGLRLYPRRFLTNQPLIAIARFRFRTSWQSLFHTPMHVASVAVEGMAINIPPKEQQLSDHPQSAVPNGQSQASPNIASNSATVTSTNATAPRSGIKIFVDQILIQNTRLVIGTSKPGKLPLDFEISQIKLQSVGPGQPMKFDATLVNPKPKGDIHSTGYFGPFQADSPGESPVSGSYVFNHADLATFKGIGGILSSTGKYQGPLNRLVVDGQADVPDFRLNTSNHPMPLRTVFHAIVNGTDGDTYLQPVQAQLGHSHFTVTGEIVRVPATRDETGDHPKGHNITLDVVMGNARIEDFLKLAVHGDPPVMNGNLHMNARIFLQPGDVPVPQKLNLTGKFDVDNAFFPSDKIQKKINELSRVGSGHPKDPDLHVNYPQPETNAPAEVKGDFTLAHGQMNFPDLAFDVPGALINLNGVYTLDGSKFDFHGQAKLQAHPSQMTTGWKSALLKLADPFFAKQGYGTVVPIEINGTKGEPHFGLDFGRKDAKPPANKP